MIGKGRGCWEVEEGGDPLGYLNTIWPRLIGEARKPSTTLSAQRVGVADWKGSISLELKIGLSAVSLPGFCSGSTSLIFLCFFPVHVPVARDIRVGLGGGVSLAYFLKRGKIQREDSKLYCEDLGSTDCSCLGQ